MTATHHELHNITPTELDAGEVFSGSPTGNRVKGYAAPCSYTPRNDPGYIFHETSRDIIVWFMQASDPLYIFGPTGSGKTSLVKQLAARLNYPVFEVTGHSRLEFSDLVGHLSVRHGSMDFDYGPLSLAMRFGGILLVNEIDLLEPATAAGLNGILDRQALCIPENAGELIAPHPMFRFVATANTNGFDETGLYQGTLKQNIAFLDRFWLCEVGYPSRSTEEILLATHAPNLPETIRQTMIDFATEVRRLFTSDATAHQSVEVTFSTRTLLRWADLTQRFRPLARQGIQPLLYALDRALGFRATPQTRAMLHELSQRMFPQLQEHTP